MNAFALYVSIYLTVVFGDRLRQINWFTAKPVFVLMYLTHMLWALSLIYDAYIGAFGLHEVSGAVAMLVLIHVTRPNWANGVPSSFLRANAHLKQPDL